MDLQDFIPLYTAASDPLIWDQHPEARYQENIFKVFFEKALTDGALVIVDKKEKQIVGSTRFYALDEGGGKVAIGFTFIIRKYWGSGANTEIKKTLIDYAFQTMKTVIFHVAATNYRSQRAVLKLGAQHIKDIEKDNGQVTREFHLSKESWNQKR